jgi:hypothetical protein
MDKPRQRTLVFCTAYTHGSAGPFYTWNQRYRTWVDAIRSTALDYDQILLIDDGSASLPDWPDVTIVRSGDDIRCDAPLVLYHFREHLGRRAVSDFPGWVRSFFFAATYAQANGFEKVVHIEADAFLISHRIQQYVNDINDGWVTLFCPLFARPESGIQIIAGSALERYRAFAEQPVDALAGAVIETTLPFTHIETSFIGDRYGEYLDYVPVQAEWCMQAVPTGKIPLDAFYWWLPKRSPPEAAAAPVIVAPPVGEQGRTHGGAWYTDFFWHFDKMLKPRRYFEVGTHIGDSLRAFSCDAVCVDPHFSLQPDVLQARRRTYLYQGTSDEFFGTDDLSRLFPEGFDVAFLDGLHHAEVLLRDFINAEARSTANSVIFLHDCLPLNERMTERSQRLDPEEDEATRDFWTGDVWKVMVALKECRPDLRMHYIDCGPSGLVACLNPNPIVTTLRDRYADILAGFDRLRLSEFGFDRLWSLFPTLSSRSLMSDSTNMAAVFGHRWDATPDV